VLSKEAARTLYGEQDAIGQQVRLNGVVGEVVGIVGDLRMRNISDPPDRIIYIPIAQGGFFAVFTLFVQLDGGPESAVPLIRARLREIDPNLPAFQFRPLSEWVENNSAPARIRTWVVTLFAVFGLAVGVMGIYGLLSYLVMLRRPEFGVRLALGADSKDLLILVLGRGLRPAVLGIAIGLIAAWGGGHLLEALLFGIVARDSRTFFGVAVLLVIAATGACYFPARRAARTDPMTVLRDG
jgi:ABC-type antimicrobial peptide transport system permease subunit